MIVGIVGSPRKNSNSEFVLRKLLKGVDHEIIRLTDYNIEPSKGDDVEYQDDMQKVVQKVLAADGIIFAFPSYFSNVPGILKNYMDRSNLQYRTKAFVGKKAIVVAGGGANLESPQFAVGVMKEYCRVMGIEVVGELALETHDLEPGEQPQEFLQKVEEFRKSLEGKLL